MADSFSCLHSGNCCELITTQINLSFGDIIRISNHTGFSFEELFKKYINLQPFFDPESTNKFDIELGLNIPCNFRKNKRCTIYEARPLNCRIFPYYIISECPESELKNIFDGRYKCILSIKLDKNKKKNYKNYADKVGDIIMSESKTTEETLNKLELNIPLMMKLEVDKNEEEAMNNKINLCKSLIQGRLSNPKLKELISIIQKHKFSGNFESLDKINSLGDKYLKN